MNKEKIALKLTLKFLESSPYGNTKMTNEEFGKTLAKLYNSVLENLVIPNWRDEAEKNINEWLKKQQKKKSNSAH